MCVRIVFHVAVMWLCRFMNVEYLNEEFALRICLYLKKYTLLHLVNLFVVKWNNFINN